MVAFVASTMSSRRPAMALPTISSDWPSLYQSAVSMRLTPASRAASTRAVASSWVVLPMAPKFIAPSARELTWTPVRPRVRYCMTCLLVMEGEGEGQETEQCSGMSTTIRNTVPLRKPGVGAGPRETMRVRTRGGGTTR